MRLQQNTDRIQTTHIGSLPRPHDVLDLLRAKSASRGIPPDSGGCRLDGLVECRGALQPHGPNRLSAFGAHSSGKREGRHSLSVKRLLRS
jgi:hypothetical protein